MARKEIRMYVVLIGGATPKDDQCIYVQARNAERAEQFARRWIRKTGIRSPFDHIKALRWDRALPEDTKYQNETDIPWWEE